jgi:hypothetical protein
MATQGMVSVIKGGKVVAKVVTGCNGSRTAQLASVIGAHGKYDPLTLAQDAKTFKVGCSDCLLIAGENPDAPQKVSVYGAADGAQVDLVVRTFQQENFNPRWERGSCDYVYRVDLDAGEVKSIHSHGETSH